MAKTQSLLNDDDIWNFPVRPTVLEGEVRAGLKRAFGGAPDVMPSPHGGGRKMAAGLQDFIMGLGQAASAPVTSALSPAAPLLDKAMNQKFAFGPRIWDKKKEVRTGALNDLSDSFEKNITTPVAKAVDYSPERAKELGLAGLMGLAGLGGKALGGLPKPNAPRLPDGSLHPEAGTFIPFGPAFKHGDDDLGELALAKNLDEGGADNPEIFRQTGILYHPKDKDWRQEISDKEAKLKMNSMEFDDYIRQNTFMRAGELIDHKELFDRAPWLRDLIVTSERGPNASYRGKSTPPISDAQGYVSNFVEPASGEISLGVHQPGGTVPMLENNFLRNLLHELQHGVQDKNQGSTQGTNIANSGIKGYLQDAGEIEARLAELRQSLGLYERRKIYPYSQTEFDMFDKRHHKQFISDYTNDKMMSASRTSWAHETDWVEFWKKMEELKGRP
jgi:hypothetical protein